MAVKSRIDPLSQPLFTEFHEVRCLTVLELAQKQEIVFEEKTQV